MSKEHSRYRWVVVAIFFCFMLLHQADKLVIGPLAGRIIEEFNINMTQWGLINTGALVVGALLYPVWGYLYDRYARSKLLALASFIWGATTWLSALMRTFPSFLVTRSSTGIDDSSYPGLYSLAADYFGPKMRGKVYGILQLTQPIGYLIGMVLALMLAPAIGWRSIFYITGSLGLVLAVVIYFGVKEMPRGQAEPELEGMEIGQYKFSWEQTGVVMKKKTMWFIFLQGFAGVFPWNVITYTFFLYLETERGYDQMAMLITMAPVILIMAGGYFVGGFLGDWAFKRDVRGRIIVSSLGVLMGAIFLFMAINTPIEDKTQFFILMALTALFMPLSSPNVISTVFDITPPEVRSTAQAVEYFVESSGAALAPLMAGIIADAFNLETSILTICTIAWLLCFVFYLGAMFTIKTDVHSLRVQMEERANIERAKHAPVS